jgi:hypothetical protein
MFNGLTPSPDRQFVKDLKTFDPKLGIRFCRNRGQFVITQPSKVSGRVDALAIEGNHGGGYRQPNIRDIRALYYGDFARKRGKDRILEGEERWRQMKIKEQENIKDDILHQTRDNKRQIANTYNKACNNSKGVTGFRQVTPKSKGYTVKDHRKLQTSID